MEEYAKLIIGVLVLLLGYFIGGFIAKKTEEELKSGKKWFQLIIIISLIMGFIGLVIGNDVLLFTMFFIAIVTLRSLKK